MADSDALRRGSTPAVSIARQRRDRPDSLRTYSQPHVQVPDELTGLKRSHSRTKSSYGVGVRRTLSKTKAQRSGQHAFAPDSPTYSDAQSLSRLTNAVGEMTPPVSPTTSRQSCDMSELVTFDFRKLDYELERAKVLGTGLWSTVYLAYSTPSSLSALDLNALTPPNTPSKSSQKTGASLFAVKVPARKDAKDVLQTEAKTLTWLHRFEESRHFIVGFEGFDERNSALVLEAALGGSLESLNGRLKQLTEVERHRQMVNLFPSLASDLIHGLEFIHSAGIVHADIKPGNILLDIVADGTNYDGTLRARYIDFSAAFDPSLEDCPKNAGGTWDFMAPEQMRIQKDLNTPTPASDVWSLGITLLALIVGGSPYTAACNGNLFMLREAIKSGNPLNFARMDPVCQQRVVASQDFIDCCRLALKKERENRVTAPAWSTWLENHEMGIQNDGGW